jgi:uncharacterized protein (TIGR02757 family)
MLNKAVLERLYRRYNRPEYVEPDPLQFLYAYPRVADREIVALVASCLAYGRVAQILRSVRAVLDRLGAHPRRFVGQRSDERFEEALHGIKHRFTTHGEIALLLRGMRCAIREHGSLGACFVAGMKASDPHVLPALTRFVERVHPRGGHLLPSPSGGSACKRPNLFLRWMVRKDRVDPGGWDRVPADKLIMPVDTHVAFICRKLGVTKRKSADLRMALEITERFREISPDDPVKYDFALTRLGIRGDLDWRELLQT